jgi:hypothetical protein
MTQKENLFPGHAEFISASHVFLKKIPMRLLSRDGGFHRGINHIERIVIL